MQREKNTTLPGVLYAFVTLVLIFVFESCGNQKIEQPKNDHLLISGVEFDYCVTDTTITVSGKSPTPTIFVSYEVRPMAASVPQSELKATNFFYGGNNFSLTYKIPESDSQSRVSVMVANKNNEFRNLISFIISPCGSCKNRVDIKLE